MSDFRNPTEEEDATKAVPSYHLRRFVLFESERYMHTPDERAALEILIKLKNYIKNTEEPRNPIAKIYGTRPQRLRLDEADV